MNSLNKKLNFYAVSALALTASIGFILQTDSYVTLKKDFNNLFKVNEKNKEQIKEQTLTIRQLTEEIAMKDDSIATLNVRIESLIEESNHLKEKIYSLDKKIKLQSDKMNVLTEQINKLKSDASASEKQIANLTKERDELLVHIEKLDRERFEDSQKVELKENEIAESSDKKEELQEEVEEAQVQLNRTNVSPVMNEPVYAGTPAPEPGPSFEEEKESIIRARKQARMNDIVKYTTIDYQSVELKDKEDGNGLKKMKNSDWRYAIISFDLKNDNKEVILDEAFTLQIFDVDNQRVVPFNEGNPSFPDSDMGADGLTFTYEGEPMQITYFNSQQKTGKNYEIRLFYAGDGYQIPITSGSHRIVKDGLIAAK